MFCIKCGIVIKPVKRREISKLCLFCGEDDARSVQHCVVPLHKSNYIVVSDLNLLTGVNNKGGLVK